MISITNYKQYFTKFKKPWFDFPIQGLDQPDAEDLRINEPQNDPPSPKSEVSKVSRKGNIDVLLTKCIDDIT